jgi:ABC-type sugar transport systems, permease components
MANGLGIKQTLKKLFSTPKKERATTAVRQGGWSLLLLVPYLLAFLTFIVAPVIAAIAFSFTDFDSIRNPNWVFLDNYIYLFTQDATFMQNILPNTLLFAVVVGPCSFILSFFLAWMLAQLPRIPRNILALLIYAPSIVSGVAVQVIWVTIFNGDASGFLNSILLSWGWISAPIQWLQDKDFLMMVMIIVTVWGSTGVGFLAMLSGILNIDPALYEAAYIDGMRNRWQEIRYVTLPSMKPQLLFGAVMSMVSTLQAGGIGVALSGSNPTPNYAGDLIVNHIEDYAFTRYEMGFASCVSVILLVFIFVLTKLVYRLFESNRKKQAKRIVIGEDGHPMIEREEKIR